MGKLLFAIVLLLTGSSAIQAQTTLDPGASRREQVLRLTQSVAPQITPSSGPRDEFAAAEQEKLLRSSVSPVKYVVLLTVISSSLPTYDFKTNSFPITDWSGFIHNSVTDAFRQTFDLTPFAFHVPVELAKRLRETPNTIAGDFGRADRLIMICELRSDIRRPERLKISAPIGLIILDSNETQILHKSSP